MPTRRPLRSPCRQDRRFTGVQRGLQPCCQRSATRRVPQHGCFLQSHPRVRVLQKPSSGVDDYVARQVQVFAATAAGALPTDIRPIATVGQAISMARKSRYSFDAPTLEHLSALRTLLRQYFSNVMPGWEREDIRDHYLAFPAHLYGTGPSLGASAVYALQHGDFPAAHRPADDNGVGAANSRSKPSPARSARRRSARARRGIRPLRAATPRVAVPLVSGLDSTRATSALLMVYIAVADVTSTTAEIPVQAATPVATRGGTSLSSGDASGTTPSRGGSTDSSSAKKPGRLRGREGGRPIKRGQKSGDLPATAPAPRPSADTGQDSTASTSPPYTALSHRMTGCRPTGTFAFAGPSRASTWPRDSLEHEEDAQEQRSECAEDAHVSGHDNIVDDRDACSGHVAEPKQDHDFSRTTNEERNAEAQPILNQALSKSRQVTPSLAQVAALDQRNILS